MWRGRSRQALLRAWEDANRTHNTGSAAIYELKVDCLFPYLLLPMAHRTGSRSPRRHSSAFIYSFVCIRSFVFVRLYSFVVSGLDISNLDFWIIVAKSITGLICWIGMLPLIRYTWRTHTYAHTHVRENAIHTRIRTYTHTPTFENNGVYPWSNCIDFK